MINLSDWQLIQIIVTIVGSAVGAAVAATAWITWRLSKVTTEVDNLKEKVKKVEDDLTYIIRLDQQESHADVRRLTSELESYRKKAMEEEKGK
jgi:uncharacterized protein (DUF697 family)